MNVNKIVLIGGGVLAEQVIHSVRHYDKNSSIIGFVDDTIKLGEMLYNVPCLGKLDDLEKIHAILGYDKLFISIGYNYLEERRAIFNSLNRKNSFYTFIHPSTYIDVSAHIGAGSFVSAGVHLEKNAIIEDNVFVYNNAVISHNTTIKSHSFISPTVSIAGCSIIGECCMLGIGSIVIDHITITDFVRIGGGTVVVDNIMFRGIYVGNPAKLIRKS